MTFVLTALQDGNVDLSLADGGVLPVQMVPGSGGGSITRVDGAGVVATTNPTGPDVIVSITPGTVGQVLQTLAGPTVGWGASPGSAWPGPATAIAAGASPTLARAVSQAHYIDTTGAQVNVTMPAAPVDGDTVTLVNRGATVTPVIVHPSAGQTIDDPASPGVAAAGNVELTGGGQSVTWLWVAALTDWVLLINS